MALFQVFLLFTITLVSVRSQIEGQSCAVQPADRKNCGYTGITKANCQARECCFDNSIRKTIWCFNSSAPTTTASTTSATTATTTLTTATTTTATTSSTTIQDEIDCPCLAGYTGWPHCQLDISATNPTIIRIPNIGEMVTVNSVEGWVIIQQRLDPSFPFGRSWNEYKIGFGDYESNFWIGLERIYQITDSYPTRLRIEYYVDYDNNTYEWKSAEYENFYIEDESHLYTLHVSGYSSCSDGDITGHPTKTNFNMNNMPFATFDRDENSSCPKCPSFFKGGWWYMEGGSYIFLNSNDDYFSACMLPRCSLWNNLRMSRMMIYFAVR